LKKRLIDFFKPEEVGRLLKKFAEPVNASALVWDEEGNLVYKEELSPYCRAIYERAPHLCERDRRERFEKAKKRTKPFIHKCFAQKLIYVIPLTVRGKDGEFFIGMAGG